MTPGLQAMIGYDLPLQGGCDVRLTLEPHWSLIGGEESRYRPRIDWFWDQVKMANLVGCQALILKPTAHLLFLAAHLAIKHGEAHSPLRWFYDIHLLVKREGQRIQWDELVARAREFRWAPALHVALAGTAARFAPPLPAGLLESLMDGTDSRDQALVQRKTRPQSRWQSTTDQLTSLSWRARLRLLLAYFLPSPAFVRKRYRPHPAWLWPLFYPYRWLDMLRDGLATSWRVANSRWQIGKTSDNSPGQTS